MADETVEFEDVMRNVEELVSGLRQELDTRWRAWEIDLTKPHLHETVGGLMARQVTLATQLAQAPQIWNGHVAPLILRAMTDVYITLAWLFEDPEPRSDGYVKHGLGQQKLLLEHRKAALRERGVDDPEDDPLIKALTQRLNAERLEHITEVSVGSWSERSTRSMAEEQANCTDLYRLAYTPFSAAVHSTWTHVAGYNLRMCGSPLHQFHRVPADPEFSPDIDYVYRAAKYVDKTFRLFDRNTGVSAEAPSAFDAFARALGDETVEASPSDVADPLDDK